MSDTNTPAAPAAAAAPGAAPAAPAATDASSQPGAVATPSDPAANPNPAPASAPAAGDGQGGADPAGDGNANAATGAPESYESFQLAEGFALEGERLTVATDFFKANNFTQAQAQEAVNLFQKLVAEDAGAIQTMLEEQRTQRIEEWGTQSRTEFGSGFEAILTDARAGVAWAKTQRPGILDTFDKEGWGNHPDALWTFAQLGKLARGSRLEGFNGETPGDRQAESAGDRAYRYAGKPQGRNTQS